MMLESSRQNKIRCRGCLSAPFLQEIALTELYKPKMIRNKKDNKLHSVKKPKSKRNLCIADSSDNPFSMQW